MSELAKTTDVRMRIQGVDDYWQMMLEAVDGWQASAIAKACGISPSTVAGFAARLAKGGYAEVTGRTGRAKNYRLVKRPPAKPRLKPDGTRQTETKIETLWRSMRMAKTFTVASLIEFSKGRESPIAKTTVRHYLRDLADVGIIQPVAAGAKTFCLVQNLGARAPRVLKARIVFDPNAQAVVGVPVASEVQS